MRDEYLIERETRPNGLRIAYYYDTDAESPRTSMDNAGTMVYWHSRYVLGDRRATEGELHALRMGGLDGLRRHLERNDGPLVGPVLPLAIYDHSGVTMWVGSGPSAFDPGGWDSGQVGFIYATKERYDEIIGGDPDELIEVDVPGPRGDVKAQQPRAEAVLRGEVEVFDHYLRGDYCGYVIEDVSGEEIESCWGYEELRWAQEEARGLADGIAMAAPGLVAV